MENVYVPDQVLEKIPEKICSESRNPEANGFHKHLLLSLSTPHNGKMYKTSLDSLKSPRVTQVVVAEDVLENLDHHPNSDLVTPFLIFYNWTFLVVDTIKFDKKTGEFIRIKGKLPVRVM